MWWILERTGDKKFPFRLRIEEADRSVLCLHVQDKWPGPKGHIFCLRSNADNHDPGAAGDEVERVPIISLRRYGKRLAVVLDRSRNKRCDFLFLTKRYKTKDGEYEQIFWRTQKALTDRRPRVKLTTRGHPALHVAIDYTERYPWRFPGCRISRESLPVGDYALTGETGILAVVERKTIRNLLHDFGNMAPLHHMLGEVETYEHSAVVIEAHYSDFLNPKLTSPYHPSFTTKALAELFALHPRLQIIFAGNRKLAREWTLGFFSAIQSHEADEPHPAVAEAAAVYRARPSFSGGGYYDALKEIREMPTTFTMKMLRNRLPAVPEATVRRALGELKKAGKLTCHRGGSKSFWQKLENGSSTESTRI
jgi:hypothetical protein